MEKIVDARCTDSPRTVTWGLVLCFVVTSAVAHAGGETDTYTAFEKQLIGMPADSWLEVPDTRMQDVCAPQTFQVDAVMGCPAIVLAWGGGAYDAAQRKMLIWGGGHNDYWGNEVYAFDLRSGRWERLNDPSKGDLVAAANADPLPDGLPNSRHTYDGLQYLEKADQLFAHGGSISPGGGGTAVTWLFDVPRRKWHAASLTGGPGGYALSSGYDPLSGLVLVRATKGLWSYDPAKNEWETLTRFNHVPLWPRYEVSREKRGAVDTKRHLFWSVGSNDFLVWDIRQRSLVTENWKTSGGGAYSNKSRLNGYPDQIFESGGGEIFNAPAPGFDYDSKADQFVAWVGGPPHILDLETKTWRRSKAVGGAAKQVDNGTFGRWRYLREYNVFILVNSVASNVFFYKNAAGSP